MSGKDKYYNYSSRSVVPANWTPARSLLGRAYRDGDTSIFYAFLERRFGSSKPVQRLD